MEILHLTKQFDTLKKKLKFKVIEDTAQAFMVKYKKNFVELFMI